MALANNLTAILNLLALLCSIPITVSGIWLASKPDNECVNLLRWPVVVLGVLILVVSACGFIGAYHHKETLLAVYLCCMAILIGLLLVVLIFAFVVTRPDGSYQVPGRGYKEYRLEGFSNWLRENVVDSKNWGNIRACLADTNVCPKLSQQFITADQFFSSSSITPLQRFFTYVDHSSGFGQAAVHFIREDYTWVGDKAQHPISYLMTRTDSSPRLSSNL
ncbi:unnamed protein product [Eruca vesicaria subsp. sativa]|uniref:Tetraspanin-2 n=1 Tax=Eruca vesicaria subsp. sativa TaxID=29727 RepID=A0ABC8JTA9_ERUVS|nr:unnamed protein product [Eruca vesicaria subsp. sativa]